MVEYQHDDRVYFAALPPNEIGDTLAGKVSDYYAYLTSSALVDLWRRSFYSYYGLMEDTALSGFGIFAIGRIRQSGQEGELASIKVNHLRNIGTHLHVLTTQQKLALKCRAINSDSESLSQASLGDGLVDYYHRDKGLEAKERDAVEIALVFGESFTTLDWDTFAGREYGVDANGRVTHEGDLVCKTYHPFNVIRDVTQPKPEGDWWILHDYANKHDLAIKYDHVAEEILKTSSEVTSGRRYVDPTKIIPAAGVGTKQSDLIDIYELRHKPTPTVPKGRKTVFLQDGTVLFDGPLPFKDLAVFRLSVSDIIGAPFGYSLLWDLLGIQQLIDKLYTVVSSNQLNNGIQNFWQPPGNQVSRVEIGGGLNLIESVVKPEVLELCSTPKEVFDYIQHLEHIMEILSTIGSTNRGSAPENVKSGTMAAYVASQALIFTSGLQHSFSTLKSSLASGLISILKDFCPTERQAIIAGKFNRPILKRFTGSQLQNIDRVVCEEVSAYAQTQGGRIDLADKLLQQGMIRNTREYINLINTGEADSMFESEMSEIILIKAENEDLRDYKKPIMLAMDDHKLHYLEHRALLANPDARLDVQLQGLVNDHCLEHFNQFMTLQMQNPGLLAWIGETPAPMPMQPPMQQPQPGGPSGQPPQAPGQSPNEPPAPPSAPKLPGGADQMTQEAYQAQQTI